MPIACSTYTMKRFLSARDYPVQNDEGQFFSLFGRSCLIHNPSLGTFDGDTR